MKHIAVFVTPLVIIAPIISGGFAQNEGEQSRSVGRLVENRNKMIITTCQNNSRRLLCELQANSLIIDSENQLYLRNIEILINTCISALTPVFTFSNRMMDNRTNLRKSTTIPLGQLSIMFDLDVCVNKTTDITMISTAVQARQGDQDITLFGMTGLILSAQTPEECREELYRPSATCDASSSVTASSFSIMTFITVILVITIT